MLRLRCPMCGTENDEEFITFPNCSHCHENLLKCRYCRHFPGKGERCRFQPDLDLGTGNVEVECTFRVSALTAERDAALVPMGSTLWRGYALVCMVFGLVAAMVSFLNVTPRPEPESPLLTVSAEVPTEVIVGSSVAATLTVKATQGTLPSRFRIRLPREFLHERFELLEMSPRADGHKILGSGHYFYFDDLPPTNSLRIRLRLRAVQLGLCRLTARVLTGDYLTDAQAVNRLPLLGEVKTVTHHVPRVGAKKAVGQTLQPLPLAIMFTPPGAQ